MERRTEIRDRIDYKILFILATLIAFGLVMIFSVASSQGHLMLFYKQVGCMTLGFIAMYFGFHWRIDYLERWSRVIYVISYVLILMLLLPAPFTRTVKGATRWLNFGFAFQVAEFVKIAVILMLAYHVRAYQNRKSTTSGEILYALTTLVIGAAPTILLMVISNDLSSSMVIAGITFVISFLTTRGKVAWILHVVLALCVVAFVVYFVCDVWHHMPTEAAIEANEVSFRKARIAAWLKPENYSKTTAYQTIHCLYAIANGGWLGKGLGQSWQKALLPESENDVIFAVIIEELGIVGGVILLLLFIILLVLMGKVALNTKDTFGRIVTVGVITHIFLQVMIHCGVCTNTIPNTGIGLPFISSGMTSSLFLLMEMMMVLSVARVYVFKRCRKKAPIEPKRWYVSEVILGEREWTRFSKKKGQTREQKVNKMRQEVAEKRESWTKELEDFMPNDGRQSMVREHGSTSKNKRTSYVKADYNRGVGYASGNRKSNTTVSGGRYGNIKSATADSSGRYSNRKSGASGSSGRYSDRKSGTTGSSGRYSNRRSSMTATSRRSGNQKTTTADMVAARRAMLEQRNPRMRSKRD